MSSPSPFRLVYTSHPRWPLPLTPALAPPPSRLLRISILDSSFNPPHSAHLALAQHGGSAFDARLLVLSTSNADKGAAEQQEVESRLEMMVEMAKEMESSRDGNVAVACIAEPAFVSKSRVLKGEVERLLRERIAAPEGGSVPEVRLTFLLGWDTLIRFFAPRYYQPPSPPISVALSSFFDTDSSSISCARRGDLSLAEEQAFLESEEVKPWVQKVELFDLGDEAKGVSSTEVRKAVKKGSWEEVERLVPVEGVREVLKRKGMYK
ncbi:hypothetical protein BCR35DRAFT_283473 [Leucosporidium creatinivorum]|uniref:Cytidyltransferase-like domain-containing protein n=1 Tax=Leucosporidium creatinivorum TaxID=106004 RepID=A0A1Y2DPT0_9BASI|nr:hypothetical protein BCR35DRAFT_283473 [Leucosporidium creatinivorum]